MNVTTRVMSARNASHCSSYISLTCSSKRSGMPDGWFEIGKIGGAALLDALNPPLDLAHRVDVVGRPSSRSRGPERCSAAGADPPSPSRECCGSRAPAPAAAPACRRRRTAARRRCAGCSRSAAASSPCSTTACSCRRSVAVLAVAAEEVQVDRQLQRRQRRVLADARLPRSDPRRCRCGCRRLRCASGARRSASELVPRVWSPFAPSSCASA